MNGKGTEGREGGGITPELVSVINSVLMQLEVQLLSYLTISRISCSKWGSQLAFLVRNHLHYVPALQNILGL